MTGKISNDKACEMIKALFAEKLKEKEDEVELISQRIKEVQSALQLVRYGSVTNLSNQTQIYVSSVINLSFLVPKISSLSSFHYKSAIYVLSLHIIFSEV